VFGIKAVAWFVACESVQFGVMDIEFDAQVGTALFVPFERLAVVVLVFGERFHVLSVRSHLTTCRRMDQSNPTRFIYSVAVRTS